MEKTKQELEVESMFGPEGNWDDYWLGNPPSTNSFMDEDQSRWVSVETLLRGPVEVGPDDETLFLMRAPGKPEGGGLMGLDEEYLPVLSGILRAGERALEEERKLRRTARNWTSR